MTASAIRCMTTSRRRCTTCRNTCYQEPLRVLRAWWHVRAAAGIHESVPHLANGPPSRPHPEPGAPLRPGARAGRRDAADGRWIYAHFLHTPASVARYARMMRGLAMELLGARQGHLHDTRLGKVREDRRDGVARHLHEGERRALEDHSQRRRRPRSPALSRHRSFPFSRPAATARAGRLRPEGPRAAALGRPRGGEKRL